MKRRCAAFPAILIAAVAVVSAPTFVRAQSFTVDVSCTKDNTLYESPTGGLSSGEGVWVYTGVTAQGSIRRTLVQFDLGAIPAGATITGANFRLYMSRDAATVGSVDSPELHRMLRNWGEGASPTGSGGVGGGGGGSPAEAGDATWLHSFYDPANPNANLWTNPGGDFVANASAATSVGSLTGPDAFYNWSNTLMAADVQNWVDNPANNFGWVLLSGSEGSDRNARRFDSRESSDPATRPLLTISYTVAAIPEPATGLLALAGALPVVAVCVARRRRRRTPR